VLEEGGVVVEDDAEWNVMLPEQLLRPVMVESEPVGSVIDWRRRFRGR